MTNKVFAEIVPTCSNSGHSAPLFISDENVAKALEEYTRSRFGALWAPLLVKRLFIALLVAFALGVVVGRTW
jgi:hypothetical protein